MEKKKLRVLFLCTGNSARSQMAEALLRQHAGDKFEACSAGLKPKEAVHPMALRVLEENGIDTSELRVKPCEQFLGRVPVFLSIILSRQWEKDSPKIYALAQHSTHWPFEDPAAVEGDDEAKLAKFREVRDQIEARVQAWVKEGTLVPAETTA